MESLASTPWMCAASNRRTGTLFSRP